MKNSKTLYQFQTASCLKDIIQSPPHPSPHQIKSYYVFRTKLFLRSYTEIYRHLHLKCFKNAVLGRQEMMQCKCFFLKPNRNVFARKFVKWERFLAVLQENILFSMSSELRFMRSFERNCIVKWVNFFASFCWLWDFLLENLKSRKKTLMMFLECVGYIFVQKGCMPKIILLKKEFIYIVVQISFFWDCFRTF